MIILVSQVFDTNGRFVYQFGLQGKEEGCLFYPRKVAVLPPQQPQAGYGGGATRGNFVVCDRGGERSRMQIFSPNGHFVRRIAIRFIDIVAGLAVSRHGDIVAVDSVTPTVFVLTETGQLKR